MRLEDVANRNFRRRQRERQTPTSTTAYVGSDYETDTVSGAKLWYQLAGIRVGFRTSAGVNWTFSDLLGSTGAVRTATGTNLKQRYFPYGQIRTTEPPVEQGEWGCLHSRRRHLHQRTRNLDPNLFLDNLARADRHLWPRIEESLIHRS